MKRIQIKSKKGWKLPKNAICVGDGTQWANPWKVVKYFDMWTVKFSKPSDGMLSFQYRVSSNDFNAFACNEYDSEIYFALKENAANFAVILYKDFLWNVHNRKIGIVLESYLQPLKGKNLACMCNLETPCHADVLVELCNKVFNGGKK